MGDSAPWVGNSLWKARGVCLSGTQSSSHGAGTLLTEGCAERTWDSTITGEELPSLQPIVGFSLWVTGSLTRWWVQRADGFALSMGAVPLPPLPWVTGEQVLWERGMTLQTKGSASTECLLEWVTSIHCHTWVSLFLHLFTVIFIDCQLRARHHARCERHCAEHLVQLTGMGGG